MQVCRGGDEISFTNMGLVAEMVLAQVCVRLVSSFVGRLARGPTDFPTFRRIVVSVCLLQAAGPSSTVLGMLDPEEEGITIGRSIRSYSATGTRSHPQHYRCENLKCRPVHCSLPANAQTDTHDRANRGISANFSCKRSENFMLRAAVLCFQSRKHGVRAKFVGYVWRYTGMQLAGEPTDWLMYLTLWRSFE